MILKETHLPYPIQALLIWALMLSASVVASKRIAITNVNVIPTDGSGLLEGQSVIVDTRMVKAGVSAYDTSKMATVHAARSGQAEHRMGQVAVGKDANLILLAENPLEDIFALDTSQAVMIRGRWFEIKALEARLDDLAFAAEKDPD